MRLIDADALPKYTGYALSADEVAKAVEKAPKYKEHYLKAFGRMLEANKEKGCKRSWNTAEEVFRWWTKDGAGCPDMMEEKDRNENLNE